jgi:hypothetical protein
MTVKLPDSRWLLRRWGSQIRADYITWVMTVKLPDSRWRLRRWGSQIRADYNVTNQEPASNVLSTVTLF